MMGDVGLRDRGQLAVHNMYCVRARAVEQSDLLACVGASQDQACGMACGCVLLVSLCGLGMRALASCS